MERVEPISKMSFGPAYLDRGLLHKAKKRKDQASECISKAIQIFKECEAELYLKKPQDELASAS